MSTSTFPFLALIFAALSACGGQNESKCKTAIERSLINPETVEFHEYKELDSNQFLALLATSGAQKQNRQVTPQQLAAAHDVMKDGMKKHPNATFSTVRVRAEGRVGNKITSQMLCINMTGECSCEDLSK